MSLKVCIKKRISAKFCLETCFETPENGNLAMLGASGGGKSMTLKCIAGIEKPDEGFICSGGRVLFDSAARINLRPQLRRCGFLFQNYALFPRMTALENTLAGLTHAKEPYFQKEKKALFWLERLGLGGKSGSFPHLLSGGEQQRLALARLLVTEPDFVLLDEPFSALDSSLREQMQLLFAETLKNYRDVILVTHSRDEAYKLSSKILIMDDGKLLIHCEKEELFSNPQTVKAARLTGCKNISPVELLGGGKVYAKNWGLTLHIARKIPPDCAYAGIRAHDLRPSTGGETLNTAPVRLTRRTGGPFEDVFLFTTASTQDGATLPCENEIWWKTPRGAVEAVPQKLFFPPEKLMPLK
ncbi:MAG: ATP-binding cassette domain-containing protein [Spirochaetaceae bacterium]|jgi:molybdate transport system ATP-binding protein|nr:ATP-binding cassette domain-containing protein [Spirochaetaceae bacterium]